MIANPSGIRTAGAASLAICVCTCQRPLMLARCLETLGAQVIPDGVAISLIVVDDTPERAVRLTVAQFCVTSPFQVYYVHEPQRGCARNAVLNKAVALGADWIAMLDDELAASDSLASMLALPAGHRPQPYRTIHGA
jgi:succinoglycan biosynthesis protein ExoM